MPSQQDLDQGGTVRQNQRIYLGPSIGWVPAAVTAILRVVIGGTTTVLKGTTLVTVSFNGAVTIQLPLAKGPAAGAGALPCDFLATPVVIIDLGGFAQAHPITILPAGAETIDSITAAAGGVQISSQFGALVLTPDVDNGLWTLTQ